MSNDAKRWHTLFQELDQQWEQEILPELAAYIKIPNVSPLFDANWHAKGHMDHAMQRIQAWCEQQPIRGMTVSRIDAPGRTPLLFMDIPGDRDDTVLLYGHMDKQPEMTGWREDLGPWQPVIENGKLYGRGGADDGYAVFSALSAIAACQQHKIPHARCVVLIEGSEESGSVDLPYYLNELKPRIGTPSLVITLDSECANYEQLWSSTSLRGMIGGTLTVEIIDAGIHSGYAGGVVPSVFSILRTLLDRIEDPQTGALKLDALNVTIPPQRIEQAQQAASIVGDTFYKSMQFVKGARPYTTDIAELMLNRAWRPSFSITGADGLPPVANAGNVMLPTLSVKVSVRIPPHCNAEKATQALKHALENDPPFGAKVTFSPEVSATGWDAPPLAPWLQAASDAASQLFFQKPAGYFGIGGSIPFMAMLGELFPEAQFLITGVLGPESNAHGPNEFLHIDMAKRVTACVAHVLACHHTRDTHT